MANALQKHKAADAIKWVVIFLIAIGLIGAVVTLFVMLDRQTTTTTIGAEAYTIAALDENGEQTDGDTSLVTRSAFTTDGLTVTIADDATVTYTLYFYDADGEFVSKTADLSADFDGSAIPEKAETAKIVITPTADEDGKVDLTEVLSYAGQVTVSVNK